MVKFVVDDKGAVAGSYDTSSYDYRYAFLRKPDGKVMRLTPPGGDMNVQVNGINRRGDIVGLYSTTDGISHGFLRLP